MVIHFSAPGQELNHMDFRAVLARVQCPTLVFVSAVRFCLRRYSDEFCRAGRVLRML